MSQKRMTWQIGGMHCIHCEAAVRKALSGLPGLTNVDVSYLKGTASADWDSAILSEKQIDARLREENYYIRRAGIIWELLKLAVLTGIMIALYELFMRSPFISRMNLFPTVSAGKSLGAVFVVGLMTSLHCIAMCGGINLSQSARSAVSGNSPWRSNLFYNLGRLISYTITGCIVGAIGSTFSIDAKVKAIFQMAAAFFMVIMACNLSGFFPLLQRFAIRFPKCFQVRLPFHSRLDPALGIGLLNGFMPCGPLQSMQLFALASGSWWLGGLSMLCFAAGTIPLMLGFGLAGGFLNKRFGRPVQWISSILVLLMGISMLTNAVTLFGIQTTAGTDISLQAQISEDGQIQTLTTELEWNSYPDFYVQVGLPVRWIIHASAEKIIGCNNEILIPEFGIDITLHEGDNLIEFLPEQAGTYPYSCWMGMIRAVIRVIDQ